MSIHAWQMTAPGQPFARRTTPTPDLGPGEVLVRIAGCGVCHTDLGFYYDGVRTESPPPLVLGHEVSGVIEAAGDSQAGRVGEAVVVPAVLPCGECPLCRKGRSAICPRQIFLGSARDGGFASHLVVPGRDLATVDRARWGLARLSLLSVVADAVSTPYQAVKLSGLAPGDVAVFVGAGGIGGFGVQVAAAFGANTIALDVDANRLDLAAAHGAAATVDVRGKAPREVREAVRGIVRERGWPELEWKIFETSGTAPGQETAWSLVPRGGTLLVVGFTLDSPKVRLSDLMAKHAAAIGNWGCQPELYPEALELVLSGKVVLEPYVERRPMSRIGEVFAGLHERKIQKRIILEPDF